MSTYGSLGSTLSGDEVWVNAAARRRIRELQRGTAGERFELEEKLAELDR